MAKLISSFWIQSFLHIYDSLRRHSMFHWFHSFLANLTSGYCASNSREVVLFFAFMWPWRKDILFFSSASFHLASQEKMQCLILAHENGFGTQPSRFHCLACTEFNIENLVYSQLSCATITAAKNSEKKTTQACTKAKIFDQMTSILLHCDSLFGWPCITRWWEEPKFHNRWLQWFLFNKWSC